MHIAIGFSDAAWAVIEGMAEAEREALREAICGELDPNEPSALARLIANRGSASERYKPVHAFPLSTGHLMAYRSMDPGELRIHNVEYGTSYEFGIIVYDLLDAFGYPTPTYESG